MADAFRQKTIDALAQEIRLLSGGRFEQFGYVIIKDVCPGDWKERGTTIIGAPRGYTVDASANGAELLAEMSSRQDYFGGDLKKIKDDLKHAADLHPMLKRIWLLSPLEMDAGATTACANEISRFKLSHGSVESVEIWDARRIAEHIFERLEVERFVLALAPYLPSVERLADEHEFSHAIPACDGYVSRSHVEDEIKQRLSQEPAVVIRGISGIGKTALAARVALALRSDFDVTIWVDARDVTDVSQLSSVQVGRFGTRHNVAGLLRRHKCLLVLDDANLPLARISSLAEQGSKIIVTCQASSEANAVQVNGLDEAAAQELLCEGVASPCPAQILQKVLANVGGHPLVLRALNALSRAEGWGVVGDCCEGAIGALQDDGHKNICGKILSRHGEDLADEIEFVKWVGAPRFHKKVAAVCVSPLAVNNLERRGFLAATAPGDARIHDIVFRAVESRADLSEIRKARFFERLERFIRAECEGEKTLLCGIAGLHAPLLKRLVRERRRPSFVYALALLRDATMPPELFGDPMADARKLADEADWSERMLEVRAVAELVEALFTIRCSTSGRNVAREALVHDIGALEILREHPAASRWQRTIVAHHYAKMLERLDRLDDAEAAFRAILAERPSFVPARFQLAKILRKKDEDSQALLECRAILEEYERGNLDVSIDIVLELLKILADVAAGEIAAYESAIMASLARVREEKALACRLVESVGRSVLFRAPQLALRMFYSVDWQDWEPGSEKDRFNLAQVYKLAAKASEAGGERRTEFLRVALAAYSSLTTSNAYYVTQHAEALLLQGSFEEADARLEQVSPERRESFWWQRKAQALKGKGMISPARDAIDRAIDQLSGKDRDKYLSAFLADKYRILLAIGDPAAVGELKKAIGLLAEDEPFRAQLESELLLEEAAVVRNGN